MLLSNILKNLFIGGAYMKYTLTHYENNITAISFPFKNNSTNITYYIDTEDYHYFVSPKYHWQQNPSESVSLYYLDKDNRRIMFRRLITAATDLEHTCVLNDNKFDLRKKNIIKYPNGSRTIRDNIRKIQKDELVPYEIDVTELKVISLELTEVVKKQKTKLNKPKKSKKNPKDKKKKKKKKRKA